MPKRSYNKNNSSGRQLATEDLSNSKFAPRRANKLKEFFGLNSIQKNLLPRARRGDTSKLGRYIRFNRNIRLVGSFAVIMLVFIATGIVVPYYIKSNNSEATAGQAIGSTLTFSAESLTASVSLSNLAKDGTFATSAANEQAKFSIATDNFTGYTLTMRSTSGNTLSGSEGNTDTFTSIANNISESTFSNSANTTYNNQWGIIPNYYYSNNATIANTDTYLKVPATNESITIDVTSAKNAEAKSYTIGIGARADYTNKIDTYSNTFILEYIANPVTYSITYNKNTTDTVNNMPATNPQTGSTSGGTVNSVNLTSNIPTRTGYTFKGWCSVSTSDDTCSGAIYNDQTVEAVNRIMNYGIDQTIDNTMVILNAMWTRNNATYNLTLDANGGTNAPTVNNIINNTGSATFTLPTTIPTYEGYNFLGWCSTTTSDNTCSGTTYSYDESTTSFSPSTITLTQTDLATNTISSSLYAIWELAAKTDISQLETMQDFASLTAEEYVAVLGSMTLNEGYELSDIRDSTKYHIGKLADGRVWMLDNLALGSTNKTYTLTSADSNVTTSFTLPKGITSGFTGYDNPYINVAYKDTVPTKVYGTEGSGKIGVYYNYAAASAGKAKGSSYSSNGDPNQDICPAGWRLPTGGSSGEFQTLCNAVKGSSCSNGDTAAAALNLRTILNTPLSGVFYNSSASDQGTGGYGSFWSSTRNYSTVMYGLYVNESYVLPQYNDDRGYGYSVRCVLKPFSYGNMQNISAETLAKILPEDGDTAPFTDSRDGTVYTIGKLADGKYWMLDNLALGGTSAISLDSTNTNLPSGTTFTLPAGITSGFNSYTAAQINVASKNNVPSKVYGTQGSGKIGVYYNYAAASAGKINTTYNSSDGDPNQDICPAGWRLPTGGSSGEFQTLCNAVKGSSCSNGGTDASALKLRDALNIPLSGYFYNSSANRQGSGGVGFFWSSTRYNDDDMYRLHVNESDVIPLDYNKRYYGCSVRCVKK